jgi:hypothetical protein
MIETISFGLQMVGIGYLCYWSFKYDSKEEH